MLELIPTEQINPRTLDIDELSTNDLLQRINTEDQQVAMAVQKAIPQIAMAVDAIREAFLYGNRLFYFGAGTSGRLGILDASECPPTYGADPEQVQAYIAGGEAALRNAIEGAEDSEAFGMQDVEKAGVRSGDIVVGLSASGQATYVLTAMRKSKTLAAKTICITCNPAAQLAQIVDFPIVVETGPEVIAGSTRMKAGTAQKMILNMLTTGAMIQCGKTYRNWMVDVQPRNAKLRERAARIVASLGEVSLSEAERLLKVTDYAVKPAILMATHDTMTLSEAQQRLASVGGKLRLALESAP